MSDLVRVSVSIERGLFQRLEQLVKDRGYSNRSEYVRDLIRQELVEREWDQDAEVVGTISLVFDHEVRDLGHRLVHAQHHHLDAVVATTHIHLDEQLCAEMIIVRGKAKAIRKLTDELRAQKGVLHVSLSVSSTGKGLA